MPDRRSPLRDARDIAYVVERVQAYCDALHALDSTVTAQMVYQGGMPHGAANVMSAPSST